MKVKSLKTIIDYKIKNEPGFEDFDVMMLNLCDGVGSNVSIIDGISFELMNMKGLLLLPVLKTEKELLNEADKG